MRTIGALLLAFAAGAAQAQPLVDYHQHLFHPAVTGWAPDTGTVTADELIAYLDAAGIGRALVLSTAYQFGNPNRPAVRGPDGETMAATAISKWGWV